MGERSDIVKAWEARFAADAQTPPVEIVLPSGLPVLARRLDFRTMLTLKMFPDALTPLVMEWIVGIPSRGGEDAPKQQVESIVRHIEEYRQVRERIWHACVVEPRFWTTQEDAEAHPDWLPFWKVGADDVAFVVDWANGVTDDLRTWLFRRVGGHLGDGPGEAGAVGDAPGLQGVRDRPAGLLRDRPAEGTDAGPAGQADGPDVGRRRRRKTA